MPSKEEIVEWLREAALISDYSAMLHTLKPSDTPVKKSVFHNRAAQVAAMRCETCELYDPGTDYATDCCLHPTISISNQGKNFGCFSHEQKE